MIKDKYTKIPNILLDEIMKELSNPELRILLTIIRQTDGWINKETGIRKKRDRISYSQFIIKTGLSNKTISVAINSLLQKKLIYVTGYSGRTLNKSERRGNPLIYYSFLPSLSSVNITSAKCNLGQNQVFKFHLTKETNTKEKDLVHIKEILDRYRPIWNP